MLLSVNLIVTLLLALRISHGVKYTMKDVSKRNVCQHGLKHNQDRTELDITVDMENEEVDVKKPFFMQFENSIYGILKKTCLIYYKFECNHFNITEGCFCHSSHGNIYNIKYVSYSRSVYSNNIVKINGRIQPEMKLPTIITDDLTAVLRINNGKRIMTTKSSCHVNVHLDIGATAFIKFCVQGLSNPTLTLSLPGQIDQSSTGDCITIVYTFREPKKQLSFKYTDLCNKSGLYECDFEPVGDSANSEPLATLKRRTTTTPAVPVLDLSGDNIFTMIISQGFLIVICSVIGIYICYKRHKLCFKDDSEQEYYHGEE